jgi:hypothetical protein
MLAKLLQLSYGPTQGKDFKSGGSIWRVRGVGGIGGGGGGVTAAANFVQSTKANHFFLLICAVLSWTSFLITLCYVSSSLKWR